MAKNHNLLCYILVIISVQVYFTLESQGFSAFSTFRISEGNTLTPAIRISSDRFQRAYDELQGVMANMTRVVDDAVTPLTVTEEVIWEVAADEKPGIFTDIGEEHGKKARENYQNALAFIKDKIAKGESLTEPDLKKIHELLGKSEIEVTPDLAIAISNGFFPAEWGNVPGQYRASNSIGITQVIPVKVEAIPQLITDLLAWVDSQLSMIEKEQDQKKKINDIAELTAKAHYICGGIIHPFTDGCGRTARLLVNYILLKNGFELSGENREGYLEGIHLDGVLNFGEERRRVDMQNADIEGLLKLNTPNFKHFLLTHMRQVNSGKRLIFSPLEPLPSAPVGIMNPVIAIEEAI